jgi:methionyl-tRNA formyltransferase
MRGETTTGVTTFQMDEGMDTGAILQQSGPVSIGADETAGELAARLAVLGAELLIDTLARLGTLTSIPQRHADATMAPRLKKSDGDLDWNRPAQELVNVVRGCNPWPGARTAGPAGGLSIWRARALPARAPVPPGTLYEHEGQLAAATTAGGLLPVEVQADNKRRMSWSEYLRGARLTAGARLHGPASRQA